MLNKIISAFATRLKGKEIVIDENIPLTYIFNTAITFFINIFRGILTIGMKSKGKFFVRGWNVKIYCKSKINIGNNVRIGSNVLLDGLSKNGIFIGNNVTLGAYTLIKCTGSLSELGKGIKIGNNFGCGENCFFGSAGGIEIGDDVIMGQSVRFHSQNHNFNNPKILIREQGTNQKGIRIGNNCWIGSGVVILDGVEIGNGCVIGANTLVNRSLPDNCIAVGNPVRVIANR